MFDIGSHTPAMNAQKIIFLGTIIGAKGSLAVSHFQAEDAAGQQDDGKLGGGAAAKLFWRVEGLT